MSTITVEELFKQLSYAELSNMAVSVDGTGTIKKEQQNKIITFANEALKRLHSRLPLSEEVVTIALTVGEDLDVTLPTNVLVVSQIVDQYGTSFTMHDRPIPYKTYVHNGVLHIPKAVADFAEEVFATYRKRHDELIPIFGVGSVPTDEDALTGVDQIITLIPELHEALTAYIAQKVYSSMNSKEGMVIAAGHRQRYEQVITEAQNQGVISGDLMPAQKLEARGFV